MRTHLSFDQAVQALLQSSFVILMHPGNGEPLVAISLRWDDEGEGADAGGFIVEPEGCDAIYMSSTDKFPITRDGRGFCVPGHALMVFPNMPFNFKEEK